MDPSDDKMIALGIDELCQIGILERDKVLDATVLRVPKAYPAYFGSYSRFPAIRQWLDGFENLYCIGRNGQHRYNNMDHSMLTAIRAVDAVEGSCPAPPSGRSTPRRLSRGKIGAALFPLLQKQRQHRLPAIFRAGAAFPPKGAFTTCRPPCSISLHSALSPSWRRCYTWPF